MLACSAAPVQPARLPGERALHNPARQPHPTSISNFLLPAVRRSDFLAMRSVFLAATAAARSAGSADGGKHPGEGAADLASAAASGQSFIQYLEAALEDDLSSFGKSQCARSAARQQGEAWACQPHKWGCLPCPTEGLPSAFRPGCHAQVAPPYCRAPSPPPHPQPPPNLGPAAVGLAAEAALVICLGLLTEKATGPGGQAQNGAWLSSLEQAAAVCLLSSARLMSGRRAALRQV